MRAGSLFAICFNVTLFALQPSLFAQSVDSLVASESEMLKPRAVGTDDMCAVYATDIADGSYVVDSESSSSMFRITKSVVTAHDGALSVSITLSGKSYSKLFLGTARAAAEAQGTGDIAYTLDENGAFVFSFPIPALNEAISCAAFSAKKGKWYDRLILFDASTIPLESLFVSPRAPQKISLKNGTYRIPLLLSGGSGKARLTNPAYVVVKDGYATAEIEWGSANYDYMTVNHKKYPVDMKILEKGGTSTFMIPVYAFNKKMPVTADTLAMSKSHEIHYWLEFDLNAAKKCKKKK